MSSRERGVALHFLGRGSGSSLGAGLICSVLSAGCDALHQPPDDKPVPREFASPTLTLGRAPRPLPAPSSGAVASASPGSSEGSTTSSSSVAPGGRLDGAACCDALREAANTALVEDQSALLFAALECDRMADEKNLSTKRLQALTGTLPLPPTCL